MRELTPAETVTELDRHIIGQEKAKRAVAIALRNRWRRQQVGDELREEIIPNNIIMIGLTGVGKTEIARRLADLVKAPFIKVEASKFTEVGYVGRDVESIIRDLTELGVNMVREEHAKAVEEKAQSLAEDRLLDLLGAPQLQEEASGESAEEAGGGPTIPTPEEVRRRLREQLRAGELEAREVDVEVPRDHLPVVEVFSPIANLEEVGTNIQEIVSNMAQQSSQRKRLQIPEARRHLLQEETQKLIDMDRAVAEAIDRVRQSGIVFLDEIDKVAVNHTGPGPDISREGVQRDLLPIIEGSTVPTKYGSVNTDHILFIAAGAFHTAKPADLIPELQGRFPIRVELDSLGTDEFIEILTRPKSALVKQYTSMLQTEGVELSFTPEAVREAAKIASQVNESMENIGARRLHTVMSTLLDELLFEAPTLEDKTIRITKQYVRDKLESILEDEDLSRYIL